MSPQQRTKFYLRKYRSVLGNGTSLFSLKTIDLGLSLWLIPFLISKIGINNYGLYAFAMALVLFFVNLLNYGFNLSTVREIAKNKNNPKKLQALFNEVLSVKLFLFVLLFSVFLLLIYLVPQFSRYKLLYLYSSLLLFGDLFSLRWFFMGIEKMKFIAWIHFFGVGIFVVLVLLNIRNADDFERIPLYQAIGMSFTSFISFVWVVRKYKFKIRFFSITRVLEYLHENFSAFVSLLLPSTYGSTLVFLVGALGLPAMTGFTQIGVKVAAAFSTLNNILTNVYFPIVNRMQSAMTRTRTFLITVGFYSSLLMFMFGGFLIEYWLNFDHISELHSSKRIVQLLSPVPFLMAVVSSYGVNGLLVLFKDRLFGRITGVSSIVMVVLAFVLVPVFPLYGGVLAFLMGRIVCAGLSAYFFKVGTRTSNAISNE